MNPSRFAEKKKRKKYHSKAIDDSMQQAVELSIVPLEFLVHLGFRFFGFHTYVFEFSPPPLALFLFGRLRGDQVCWGLSCSGILMSSCNWETLQFLSIAY